MSNLQHPKQRWTKWTLILAAAVLVLAVGAFAFFAQTPAPAPSLTLPPAPFEATAEQVHQFCGACHAYPPPETFPRFAWRREVKQAYDFFAKSSMLGMEFPPLESIALYYENRAPQTLPLLARAETLSAPPMRFEPRGFHLPDPLASPGVSNVNLA